MEISTDDDFSPDFDSVAEDGNFDLLSGEELDEAIYSCQEAKNLKLLIPINLVILYGFPNRKKILKHNVSTRIKQVSPSIYPQLKRLKMLFSSFSIMEW